MYDQTMQEPPIYAASYPPKKKNGCLIWGLIIGGTCLVCILLTFGGGLFLFNKGKEVAGCTFQFESIHSALQEYAHEHKGALPKATTWMEDIRPYYSRQIGQIKGRGAEILNIKESAGAYQCEQNGTTTGIALNKDLAGKKLSDQKDSAILIFETEAPAMNLAETFKERPKATSPLIMNEHRGWITETVDGDLRMGQKPFRSRVGGGSFRVDTYDEPKTSGKNSSEGDDDKGDTMSKPAKASKKGGE